MTIIRLRGDQVGEALQFDPSGLTTTVEIGRVWFKPTDIVELTVSPAGFDAAGAFVGGAGSILALRVISADGQVTTFSGPTNPLDVDPDQSKQGADFFYISESPGIGVGGAYAGLQLEKIVVTDVSLIAGSLVPFGNVGGYTSTAIFTPPAPLSPGVGTPGNDILTGTAAADTITAGAGNDRVTANGGNDMVRGGDGNDVINGGTGNDSLLGEAGNDRLLGGAGTDRLSGGQGEDLLDGGAGSDILTGGQGGDAFVFGAGDRVTDFNAGQGDMILFNAAQAADFNDLTITVSAAGTTISFNGGSMLLAGYFGPLEDGNQVQFDYMPSNDFL